MRVIKDGSELLNKTKALKDKEIFTCKCKDCGSILRFSSDDVECKHLRQYEHGSQDNPFLNLFGNKEKDIFTVTCPVCGNPVKLEHGTHRSIDTFCYIEEFEHYQINSLYSKYVADGVID